MKSVVKTTMMEQTCGGKTMVLGGRTSLGWKPHRCVEWDESWDSAWHEV